MSKYDNLNRILHKLSMAISFFALLILVLIVAFIINKSLPFIKSGYADTLATVSWRPLSKAPSFGLLPMVSGTLYIGFLSSFLAFPISVGCAAFSTCYLKGRQKQILLSLMDMLAGVPSVVYGLLGFYTLIKLLEMLGVLATGESILAATITLSIMIMPYMISGYARAFEDAEQKYGLQSQALGVSPWYSLTYLTFACTKGNMMTGYLLALSKALGETMAVMMVVGNSPVLPKLFGKGITISGLIALEMGAARLDSLHYYSLYTAGIVLLVLLLAVNFAIRSLEKWTKKV